MRFEDDGEPGLSAKESLTEIQHKTKCVDVINVEQGGLQLAHEINSFIGQARSSSNFYLPI